MRSDSPQESICC